MIKKDFIKSSSDKLKIELAYAIPKGEIKGIVQIYNDILKFIKEE